MCAHPVPSASAAHCSGCHQTFASVRLFDMHQRWIGGKLSCLAPGDVKDGGWPLRWVKDRWRTSRPYEGWAA